MTPAELELAEMALSQGLQFWADFQAKKAAGTLTQADLTAAAAALGTDVDAMVAARAAQKAAGG